MNVFNDIRVQPAYGFEQALISWTLNPSFEAGNVYVYRSPNGVEVSDEWEILNLDDPVLGSSFFIDNALDDKNFFRQYFYRLVLELDGEYYDSPVIGMFNEGLNKSEYGVLRYMRKQEYLRMRSRNGVRVLHCIPTIQGSFADGVDSTLLTRIGTPCKNGDKEDPEMYEGTNLFTKQFSTVSQTWAEIQSIGALTVEQVENSLNNFLSQKYKLRLLGFPTPEVGHMIVLPNTDKRLLVTDNINPFLFKGYLPIAYEVIAEELPRTDSRYKIPLPLLNQDPERPITVNRAL